MHQLLSRLLHACITIEKLLTVIYQTYFLHLTVGTTLDIQNQLTNLYMFHSLYLRTVIDDFKGAEL